MKFFILLIIFSACSTKQDTQTQPPVDKKSNIKKPVKADVKKPLKPLTPSVLTEPEIWNTALEVNTACDKNITLAQNLIKDIQSGKYNGNRIVLDHVNKVLIYLDRILPSAELFNNAHEKKEVREAAEKCEQRGKKILTSLKLDTKIYQAIKSVPLDTLDITAKRFVSRLLLEYQRSGVNRDEKTRTLLASIEEKIVKLGQKYMKNIAGDKRSIKVRVSELKGLPVDFIKRKKVEKKMVTITTDYPDFFPVQKYAVSSNLRRNLYREFLSRGMPENDKLLKEILILRDQYASILGYKNFAAYNAEDKMVKNEQTIESFIKQVAKEGQIRAKRDLTAILKRKKKDNPKARRAEVFDRFYYIQKIQTEQYRVNPADVRAYFNFKNVKEGVMAVNQELFGVTFKKIPTAKVWHSSVEAYDIIENGKTIARFYLDMHSREGKYGHAAEFPIYSGVSGIQLPSAALVTNFPDPSKSADGIALMEHDQVTTFFHEFGHLMHQLFAGNHKWVTMSGINCEWDFVEAPSQLMEEWAWDYDVLKRFARHYKTKKIIDKNLVEKMKSAAEFGKGVHIMRQMFYAALSFTYHSTKPAKLDLRKVMFEVQKQYSPWPTLEKTAEYASFGHLVGYSSQYYTYMWSLVIAKDLFSRFKRDGIMSNKIAADYRNHILSAGGSRNAEEMVKSFLGRSYNYEAFFEYLKGSSTTK